MEGHTSSMKMTRYDHVTINAYRSVIIMYLIVSIKLVRLSTLQLAISPLVFFELEVSPPTSLAWAPIYSNGKVGF